MLVAQNSLGPVCPVPLTVRGTAAMDPTLPFLTLSKKDLIQLFFAMVPRMNGGTLLGFMTLLPSE